MTFLTFKSFHERGSEQALFQYKDKVSSPVGAQSGGDLYYMTGYTVKITVLLNYLTSVKCL